MSEFKGEKYLFTMQHSGRVYYQNNKTPEFKDWESKQPSSYKTAPDKVGDRDGR